MTEELESRRERRRKFNGEPFANVFLGRTGNWRKISAGESGQYLVMTVSNTEWLFSLKVIRYLVVLEV